MSGIAPANPAARLVRKAALQSPVWRLHDAFQIGYRSPVDRVVSQGRNRQINAVLLESANDASVALGEKIAGSEEKFANLMTISARMWGAQNTACRTASGLTAVGQQSTARDLANLFRFAMQHEPFAERMKEKSIRTSYGKNLRNHNKALWKIDGAVGGKTGYTLAARQTYVGMFSRDGRSIVVCIMGRESRWADLAKLVEYGFRRLPAETTAASSN